MASKISKFSQIISQLPYPSAHKGRLSQIHSEIITATMDMPVINGYTTDFLKNVIKLMNFVTYDILLNNNTSWSMDNPLDFKVIDESIPSTNIRDYLDKMHLYIEFRDIKWADDGIERISSNATMQVPLKTIPTVTEPVIATTPTETEKPSSKKFVSIPAVPEITPIPKSYYPTPKEDLYLNPPTVPQFDTSKVFASGNIDNTDFAIYNSLPLIPERQTDISVTTEVSKMTSRDLMKLFPNRFIPTRSAALYEQVEGIELHQTLGLILPIKDYTREQLIDNIIQYPHIYKLTRVVDGREISFYTHIEINGVLHKVADIWKTLPESKIIPFKVDLVKDYVVRRYLLERDVDHIQHKYPLANSLKPYLTLCMTPEQYSEFGYTDSESLARACVESRVDFKRSRNPVLQKLLQALNSAERGNGNV